MVLVLQLPARAISLCLMSEHGQQTEKRRINVVGAVIIRDGLILCARRSNRMSLPGMWEFPGGKIEVGESPQEALRRELQEELQCDAQVGDQLEVTTHEYDFGIVTLTTFYCQLLNGEPLLTEHSAIRWMPPSDLGSVEWAPADRPAVARLQSLCREPGANNKTTAEPEMPLELSVDLLSRQTDSLERYVDSESDHDDPASRDAALDEVFEVLSFLDPDGTRAARVFRDTFDQLYDGQHTGRYRLDHLSKTEKAHFGSIIEINLQREFQFNDGSVLDYSIATHEVDCKFSHTSQWMLPTESFDQIVLVTVADDMKSQWSMGLVRVSEENRRASRNRDQKTGLNAEGKKRVRWVHQNAPMQPNTLLTLPEPEVEWIMSRPSGQKRVDELLKSATGRRISRTVIATVAQQKDYMKRIRENGGSRSTLRKEGILVLSGDYKDQTQFAAALGTAVPERGEIVSVRVKPTEDLAYPSADGRRWRICLPGETTTVDAPMLR